MLNVKDIEKEKIVVIADDLTGAGEIAAILKRSGKRSLVINNFAQNSKIRKLWNSYEGMIVITKTGGFGGKDVFLKAVDYINRNRGAKIER